MSTLNSIKYTVSPDNLIIAAGHPTDEREVSLDNPQVELLRGMLVKIDSNGKYFVAGALDSENAARTGDVVGILKNDADADTTSETVGVEIYISGAFNLNHISGLANGSTAYTVTDADIVSAQMAGLYIK